MTTVELIYDAECPNVNDARSQLIRAFHEAGVPPKWMEWDRAAPETPAHARGYGSPTILVDGRDVADVAASDGAECCRVYMAEGGKFSGVPSVKTIASALSGLPLLYSRVTWLFPSGLK